MTKKLSVATISFLLGLATFVTFAQDVPKFEKQIEARQSFMRVYAFNLGLLGSMAKGETPYDAQRATDAAENLLANAKMKNSAMWPAESDADAPGLGGVTRAKAVIWSSFPELGEKHQALTDALTEMVSVAGNGLDAVRSNMGAVGKGCKGCHEAFRVPEE
jgi:cytochrome c556